MISARIMSERKTTSLPASNLASSLFGLVRYIVGQVSQDHISVDGLHDTGPPSPDSEWLQSPVPHLP